MFDMGIVWKCTFKKFIILKEKIFSSLPLLLIWIAVFIEAESLVGV